METSRRTLQVIRIAMLISIVFYVAIVRMVPSKAIPNPIIFYVITAVVAADVVVMLILRRVLVIRSEEALLAQPENPIAITRWRIGYLLTYCISESIAIFGVLLHFLGFTFTQVSPFFIAGFALILFCGPRHRTGMA